MYHGAFTACTKLSCDIKPYVVRSNGSNGRVYTQTDRQTDRCYQTHYLPASWLITILTVYIHIQNTCVLQISIISADFDIFDFSKIAEIIKICRIVDISHCLWEAGLTWMMVINYGWIKEITWHLRQIKHVTDIHVEIKVVTHFTRCYTIPLRINSGLCKCVFKRVHLYVSAIFIVHMTANLINCLSMPRH